MVLTARFYFSLAVTRIGIVVFIFHWHFPELGQPFSNFVGTFPHWDNDSLLQNAMKSSFYEASQSYSAKIT